MKKFTYLLLASSFIISGISSCSSTNTETTDSPPTTEAVTTEVSATATDSVTSGNAATTLAYDSTNFGILAASNDLLEIMSSEEALANAKNPEVKNFARQMVDEHKKAYQEIKTLSASKSQRVPTELLPKHQRMYAKYKAKLAKEPNKYDKVYMELQESAHEEAVELFDDGDEDHPDPELKAYAARHFPHIKAHFELAKKTKGLVD